MLLPPSVTKLDLSHNYLETIGNIGLLPSNLQHLALNDNNLRHFSEDQLVFLQKLKVLKLGDNPFYCNCSSEKLFEFVRTSRETTIEDVENVTLNCSSIIKLYQISTEDFCINSLRNIEILFILVAILTFVTAAVIGLGTERKLVDIKQS